MGATDEHAMSKFTATVKHEFLELIPPTLYFFVVLHIVALIRSLMTRNTDIDVSTSTSIAVGALILGKAVLLANALPFINRYPESHWSGTCAGRPRSIS